MNKIKLGELFALLVASLSALAVLLILKSPFSLFFSIGFGFLVYLLYIRLILNKKIIVNITASRRLNIIRFIIPIILFIFSVVFVTRGITNSLFLNWYSIPASDWLSISAAIILTTFLPGFFILNIFRIDRTLSLSSGLTLKVLVSVFFSGILSFICLSFGYTLSNVRILLILFNGILLMLYSLQTFRLKAYNCLENELSHGKSSVDLTNVLVLGTLIALLLIGIFITFFTNFSFLKGDMWREFSIASTFTNMDQVMISSLSVGTPLFFPYWSELYLAAVFESTTFPLINSYLILAFLNIFSIIAFYSLASNVFRNRSAVILSTVVWALFSGFGWLYTLNTTNSTLLGMPYNWFEVLGAADFSVPFSISKPFGYWANDVCIQRAFAFICSIMLLSVILTKKLSLKKTCVLTGFLIAFSYLLHVYEAVVFILVLFLIVAIFQCRRSMSDYAVISFSLFSGLLFVFLIDSISIYSFYKNTYLLYFLFYSLGLSLSLYLFSRISMRAKAIFDRIRFFFGRAGFPVIIATLLISIYGIAVVVYLLSNFFYGGYLLEARVVPWYLYPMKLGVAGLITAIGIWFSVLKRKGLPDKIKFLLCMVFVLFLFGVLISYIKTSFFYIPYEEIRVVDQMFPFIALLTGWLLARFFISQPLNKFRKFGIRRLCCGLFLALIVLTGSLSSAMSSDVWSLTNSPWGGSKSLPDGFTDVINYMRQNCEANSTIATTPNSGDNDLVSLVGLRTLADNVGSNLNHQLFDATGPSAFYGIASTWNVQYIYFSNEGLRILKENYPHSYIAIKGFSLFDVWYNNTGNLVLKITVPQEYIAYGYDITSRALTLTGQMNLTGRFFSFPTTVSSLSVSNNQTIGWRLFGVGKGNYSAVVTNDFATDDSSLTFSVGAGEYARWQLSYDFGSSYNLSAYDILSFNWHGTSTYKQLIVRLTSASGDWFGYIFKDDFSGERNITVDLSSFDLTSGGSVLSNVRWIDIHPYNDADTINANYSISQVALIKRAETFIPLSNTILHPGSLDLSQASDILIDGLPSISCILTDIQMINLAIDGDTTERITANDLTLQTYKMRNYLVLDFKNSFNYSITLNANSSVHISVKTNDGIYHSISIRDGTVKIFNLSLKTIISSTPLSIETIGNTTFSNLLIYHTAKNIDLEKKFGGVYAYRQIFGSLTFNIIDADRNTIYIGTLNPSGNVATNVIPATSPSEFKSDYLALQLPQVNMIAFTVCLVALLCLTCCSAVWATKRRTS